MTIQLNCIASSRHMLLFSVDNILSAWSVGDHGDGESQLLLYELNIFPAVLRQILVFLNASDIAFPSRQDLQHRFCLFQKMCGWEFCGYFPVNFISHTYRDLI